MTVITNRQWGPFGYDDLEDTPSDDYRREIIGGSLFVFPMLDAGHQRAASNLVAVLRSAATPESMVLSAPFDWRHSDGGVVQPDLLVVDQTDVDVTAPLPPSTLPLLVVEILSGRMPQYDETMKRDLYESLGVPAYWIVDPAEPSVLALRLTDGAYAIEAQLTGNGEFSTDFPFPVAFRPTDLGR